MLKREHKTKLFIAVQKLIPSISPKTNTLDKSTISTSPNNFIYDKYYGYIDTNTFLFLIKTKKVKKKDNQIPC